MKPSSRPPARVLAVDLDGTLLKGDLLWESLTRYILPRIWRLASMLAWTAKGGRPLLKARLAAAVPLNPALLNWHQPVLQFCAAQAAQGTPVVLATASNIDAARRITGHLPFLSRILGSDPTLNLKGPQKAARLTADYGTAGFDYIGDSAADLPVWQAAQTAWFVGPEFRRARLERKLGKPLLAVPATDPTAPSSSRPPRRLQQHHPILGALRPHQWLKNILIFFPLIAAHRWLDAECWTATITIFVALCGMASASYLLNDLADLDADRAHPRKKSRPLASGTLGIPSGLTTMTALFLASGCLAASVGPAALAATLAYFILSVVYSLALKTIPVLDGVFLSGLYTYRMVLGGIAGGVMISPWLLAFSTTFFLGLAFLKRYVELSAQPAANSARLARRGYEPGDIGYVFAVGVAAGFLSVVVLALYLESTASESLYAAPHWLWLIALMLLFWIMRVWFLAGRKALHDDPVWFAARDRTTWALALGCAAAMMAAKPL